MTFYVHDFRVKKGWSTAELAKRSGVAASHINGIENKTKNPTIDVMCKLAKAFGVPVCDLFSCD